MIRSTLLPLLLVSGVALANPSQSASTADEPDFDTMDKNKDGLVDRAEARNHAKLNSVYEQVDNDKNGKISRPEYEVFKKEKAYAMSDGDQALFTKLDSNKDRHIDKTEASAAADLSPSFAFADDDSNGKLTETEWMKWRQETTERADETGKSGPKDEMKEQKDEPKKY